MIPSRTLLRTMQTASLASPPSKAVTDALARVSPAQLAAVLDDPEVLVVDVRRADMDDVRPPFFHTSLSSFSPADGEDSS